MGGAWLKEDAERGWGREREKERGERERESICCHCFYTLLSCHCFYTLLSKMEGKQQAQNTAYLEL